MGWEVGGGAGLGIGIEHCVWGRARDTDVWGRARDRDTGVWGRARDR